MEIDLVIPWVDGNAPKWLAEKRACLKEEEGDGRIDSILHSPAVETVHKEKLQKMVATKGQLSFYDVFTLSRPAAA